MNWCQFGSITRLDVAVLGFHRRSQVTRILHSQPHLLLPASAHSQSLRCSCRSIHVSAAVKCSHRLGPLLSINKYTTIHLFIPAPLISGLFVTGQTGKTQREIVLLQTKISPGQNFLPPKQNPNLYVLMLSVCGVTGVCYTATVFLFLRSCYCVCLIKCILHYLLSVKRIGLVIRIIIKQLGPFPRSSCSTLVMLPLVHTCACANQLRA